MTGSPSDADALRRRLRDDPDAAASLDGLRRAAYGRAADEEPPPPDAPPPDAPRPTAGTHADADADADADALPAPLVALLAVEARLVEEGRRLLAAEADRGTASGVDPAPGQDRREEADRPDHDHDPAPDPAPTGDAPHAPRSGARRGRLLRPAAIAAALAGVVLVAGLGTASASGLLSDDDGWRSQEPTSTPGPPSTPDPRLGMPVPEFTTEPPAQLHEDLTDAETAAALRESADAAWQRVLRDRPDAVRPDVPVERILEGEEWVRQQAACLGESGVRVQVIGTGDDARLGTDTADAVVRYVCQVRFAAAPRGPLTTAALSWLHDYFVDRLIPCYAAAGEPYEGEVPDRDTAIARARAGDPWQPSVATPDGILEALCPGAPAGFR
ncbi:hypothetical protein [Clavibacter zhangzhiyongii]|uniref:hypothetical protein n=1 Tax=Clavibacter zhangzhiyongii TaxID=2768071 RepID=UPI001FD38C91|nr:hypothetical protein [Clavibacter zhangzhiyongii]